MNNSKLLIIDLSNFIFRAYYGVKPLFNKEGLQTNAIHGVCSMFLNLLKQTHPSHVIIAIDSDKRKDRSILYSEYKMNRKETPKELSEQIAPIKEFFKLINICQIVSDGQEADDVIGTLAVKECNNFNSIFIASSDKDLMQLISGGIYMFDSMKGVLYDKNRVFEKFQVYPEQIIDYLSLVGDKSDNIPGVQGIGPKTASQLILDFNSIDGIYQNIDSIKSDKVKEKLLLNKDNCFLSKELVTINKDLDLKYSLCDCEPAIKLNDELTKFLEKYELDFIKGKISQYI